MFIQERRLPVKGPWSAAAITVGESWAARRACSLLAVLLRANGGRCGLPAVVSRVGATVQLPTGALAARLTACAVHLASSLLESALGSPFPSRTIDATP